jgi:hypothetical protein
MFDGQTVIRPQARVRIDATGLVPTVLGSANVVMAFGSATGGAPKTVYSFTNYSEAASVLKSGSLLKALKRMWNASQEVPGASTIRVVRIDPATKSTLTLDSKLKLDSLDYGTWTTGIQIKVETGTTTGKKITVNYAAGGITEVWDNLGTVAAAVAAINNVTTGSTLVTASLVLEGTITNSAYASMTGGADGTPVNSDWTDGFNLIDANPSNVYYAATADASVLALLVAQVNLTSQNKLGGQVVAGAALGETAAQIAARAATYAANQGRVVMCGPGTKDFDDSGAVVTEGAYLTTAPKVAGLIAGLPIQRALTYKTIDGLGLDKDFSQADLDILEQAGVLSVENVPNRGLRVVHGQTTWTGDLNPLFREISVRRIADVISYQLKTDLSAFVGEPGSVFTINAIKARVESIMVEAEKAGLITPGVDDAGREQPSYRNIHVKFNSASGICYVEVECSPVTPVNFILCTAHFRATNIVA